MTWAISRPSYALGAGERSRVELLDRGGGEPALAGDLHPTASLWSTPTEPAGRE